MWSEVSIEDAPRLAGIGPRVKCLGATHGGTYPERIVLSKKLEVCLRLYSRKKLWVNHINGVRHSTRFPHAHIKYPGEEHRFVVDEPVESFYFAYAPEAEEALRKILPLPPTPIWEITMGEKEGKLVAELSELMEHSRDYGAADRIDILSLELLELVTFQFNLATERPDYNESKIRAIASHIQLHYRDDIDIDDIARRHGMSRSTLERHWRKFFKTAPGEYVRALRIENACRLLRENPRVRVSEISRSLNFQDDAYFCALFRRHVGVTPSAWREGSGK